MTAEEILRELRRKQSEGVRKVNASRTPQERSALARKAALARWARHKEAVA